VGERINKIRFVGSINKEIRFRKSVTRIRLLEKKKRNAREGEEKERVLQFLLNQVRVRLITLLY